MGVRENCTIFNTFLIIHQNLFAVIVLHYTFINVQFIFGSRFVKKNDDTNY